MITTTFALALALAVVMGAVLGLLGGGGSILTVPILLYVLHTDPKQAIPMSLVVVGTTALVGMLQHARLGNVAWRTGLVFGGVAMLGAYVGGRCAVFVSGGVLVLAFASLTAVTGLFMLLRKRRPVGEDADAQDTNEGDGHVFNWWQVALQGFVVGAITGLVGAGGGFVVVPALVFLGGLSMRQAIGTSLLVIAMNSTAGVMGHLTHVSIDLRIVGGITLMAVLGSFIGAAISKRLQAARLRQGFAVFVLAMAVLMFYREGSVLLHTSESSAGNDAVSSLSFAGVVN